MKKAHLIFLLVLISFKSFSQYNIGRYHVDGYYENIITNDTTKLIKQDMALTITNGSAYLMDIETDTLVYSTKKSTKRLVLVGTLDGEELEYFRWMIPNGNVYFYEKGRYKYLIVYTLNDMKLPEIYVKYRISSDLEYYLKKDF